jgi:spore germination protein GerM
LKRVIAVVIAIVVIAAAVWYVRRRAEAPVPPEQIGEIERAREATLYFGSRDASGLIAEYRRVASSDDALENLRGVIEGLVGGPRGDGVPTIPSSVRLLAVFIRDKTAFLDFSQEIIGDFSGGTAAEYMLIASIVQTACANFPEVEAVRILVEGEEVDSVGGHLYIARLLRPDEWR